MRRRFFIIILLAAITLPVVSVYAQEPAGSTGVTSGFKALAPIPGLTDPSTTSVVNSDSLAEFFNNLYIYAIGLAAAIAVIQIIRAGLEIAFFNKDSVSKLMDSKGRIAQSIYGLILIFSPVVVFSIINPAILNLELNLQPLDTAPLPFTEKWSQPDGTACYSNDTCASKICNFSEGKTGSAGRPVGECSHVLSGQCTENTQCVSGYCDTGGGPTGHCRAAPKETRILMDGAICQNDLQCPSKICDYAGSTPVCLYGSNLNSGQSCNVDRQCKSKVCDKGIFSSTCK